MFKKVTIIGFGLIGSSIGYALKRSGQVNIVVAADKSEDVCQAALQYHLADEAITNLRDAVADAEIVILAVPVGAMSIVMKGIAPFLEEGAIVTDTGSVKGAVAKTIMSHLPEGVAYVPAHPIVSLEDTNPLVSLSEPLKDQWVVLTPLPETPLRSVEKATYIWELCGTKIDILSTEHHDGVLAVTSHLPRLLAYTAMQTAINLEEDIKSEVIQYSASGMKDLSHLIAANPSIWADVFLDNKGAILESLEHFVENLTSLQNAIRHDDKDYLHKTFSDTRKIGRVIIEQEQESSQDVSGQKMLYEANE